MFDQVKTFAKTKCSSFVQGLTDVRLLSLQSNTKQVSGVNNIPRTEQSYSFGHIPVTSPNIVPNDKVRNGFSGNVNESVDIAPSPVSEVTPNPILVVPSSNLPMLQPTVSTKTFTQVSVISPPVTCTSPIVNSLTHPSVQCAMPLPYVKLSSCQSVSPKEVNCAFVWSSHVPLPTVTKMLNTYENKPLVSNQTTTKTTCSESVYDVRSSCSVTTSHKRDPKMWCIFCSTPDHASHDCRMYNTSEGFWSHVHGDRLCKNCLRPYHKAEKCYNRSVCKIGGCLRKDKHSPVLCRLRYSGPTKFSNRQRFVPKLMSLSLPPIHWLSRNHYIFKNDHFHHKASKTSQKSPSKFSQGTQTHVDDQSSQQAASKTGCVSVSTQTVPSCYLQQQEPCKSQEATFCSVPPDHANVSVPNVSCNTMEQPDLTLPIASGVSHFPVTSLPTASSVQTITSSNTNQLDQTFVSFCEQYAAEISKLSERQINDLRVQMPHEHLNFLREKLPSIENTHPDMYQQICKIIL